jgi:glutathione synthase/RimK-type ligase-like ATP-grasp enzyme
MNKETLEEAADRHIHGDKRKNFIRGAEWQAERMYSEEEVIAILYQQLKALDFYGIDFKFGDWFEQFKKK